MKKFKIGDRSIGADEPVYIIAEMSGNHGQTYENAVKILHAAKDAGADAVKLQTYTPDTITIPCDNEYFRIEGTIWDGRTLHDLYGEAYTPWDWQPKLQKEAENLGLDLFSTPFDETAIEFLEEMQVPVYKVASFENVDLGLLKQVAATGKPVIMSTGMADLSEIDEAVGTLRANGCDDIALLKCTSSYPATPEECNLLTIPHMAEAFAAVVGISDHTLDIAVPVGAVALGARIIEKHLTLSRAVPGPDNTFSLEPDEFKSMVQAVRSVEKAVGKVAYGVSANEAKSRVFRRSLFVVKDVQAGEGFTTENVHSIRPGYGMHTRYLDDVIGRRASRDIKAGTPLGWQLVS